ncbi:hypothetical protein GOP47_0005095 [Adiantum capillus-veneris]|uniref:Uncharacterized protein n=1 Tax=Adiantum capillus-veneris TaxID=13818 RepID=A0A9D4ZNA7_ADICA|nr:hypothetical protein GOP47_0005095 [Adiantum capillus-veneris]
MLRSKVFENRSLPTCQDTVQLHKRKPFTKILFWSRHGIKLRTISRIPRILKGLFFQPLSICKAEKLLICVPSWTVPGLT